jgi:hypothetical protein
MTEEGSSMKTLFKPEKERFWTAPTLTYKGTVADILRTGGGKLSLSLADTGEKRCEKPHIDKCTPF